MIGVLTDFLIEQTSWFALGVLSAFGVGFGFPTGTMYLFPHVLAVSSTAPTLFNACVRTLPAALSWGVGTAVGELPPYYLGRMKQYNYPKIQNLIMEKGRFFVFLMACYPNMLFDCIGIACGTLHLPVSFFFIPTLLGKACVKAPLQNLVMCLIGYFGYDTMKQYLPNMLMYQSHVSMGFITLCYISTFISCGFYIQILFNLYFKESVKNA